MILSPAEFEQILDAGPLDLARAATLYATKRSRLGEHRYAMKDAIMLIQENELLGKTLGRFGKEGIALLNELPASDAGELRVALANFLVDLAKENTAVTVDTEILPSSTDFKSILYKSGGVQTNRRASCRTA